MLMIAGAQVNARESWNGQSALQWAAAEGHGAVVEALIEGGADIRARSNAGTTPLMFAVRKGDMASVNALLAAGADVNEKRVDLATPLLVAIINGHEDLVDLLLDKGADPNVEGGSTDLSVQGVESAPDQDHAQDAVLSRSTARSRHRRRQRGATTAGDGRCRPPCTWPTGTSATSSSPSISIGMRVIKSLLEHGADVNARNTDMEPRWSGARYRRRQVGLTPFLAAARQADIEVMRLLLENGADPKLNTPLNITPLMLAAGIAWASNQDRASEEQVLEAVKMLVEELGADVNFVADTGETAMHAAAYRGANSVVQYLFDKGAKLDVVGPERTNARCRSPMVSSTEIHSLRIRIRRCCCASLGRRKFRVPACART